MVQNIGRKFQQYSEPLAKNYQFSGTILLNSPPCSSTKFDHIFSSCGFPTELYRFSANNDLYSNYLVLLNVQPFALISILRTQATISHGTPRSTEIQKKMPWSGKHTLRITKMPLWKYFSQRQTSNTFIRFLLSKKHFRPRQPLFCGQLRYLTSAFDSF